MNSEPCVRLGIRISPKISENPAESRNNRPPSVMLLTASTSMRFIAGAFSTRFRLSLVIAGLGPAISIHPPPPRLDKRDGRDKAPRALARGGPDKPGHDE